jgi:dienelactone hydrolase
VNAARAWTLASFVVVASWHAASAMAQPSPAGVSKERVTFQSDHLALVGFLFKPDGPGPFPGLIWNHGSEKSPGTMRQFDAVAAIFVPAGYVVFAPMRRGHGDSGAGYRAAAAISPGALSWNGNTLLRDRLVAAVRKTEIPVFIIQPPKDASLEPSRVLGAELERRGPPHAVKVYPADMPEDQQGHCFGGARGMHVWAQDVLAFFAGALR